MLANPFTRRHLQIALIVLGVFLFLNGLIAWWTVARYGAELHALAMVLAVPLGPLTGAVVRGWPWDTSSTCCIANAFDLLPPHAAVLAIGVLLQWAGSLRSRVQGRIRLTIWTLSWIAWYAGGILSLGHSLE